MDCISFNSYSARGTDPAYPFTSDAKNISNGFGIGVLAGLQYYLKPMILELKCDLDFLPIEIKGYSGSTPIHSNTRLIIVIPLRQL